jgi:hypothetical protein
VWSGTEDWGRAFEKAAALVAGICVSSPGLSEMNFNLCANMQLSLHHDRFLANDDGSRYS